MIMGQKPPTKIMVPEKRPASQYCMSGREAWHAHSISKPIEAWQSNLRERKDRGAKDG